MSSETSDGDGSEPQPVHDGEPPAEAEPEQALAEADTEELDPANFADQEWTLGGETRGVVEFGGVRFLVEDPDDDEILDMLVGAADDEGSPGDRLYELCRSAVVEPELSPDRWRGMRAGERIGLAARIGEWAGIDQLMDFPDGGPGRAPDE